MTLVVWPDPRAPPRPTDRTSWAEVRLATLTPTFFGPAVAVAWVAVGGTETSTRLNVCRAMTESLRWFVTDSWTVTWTRRLAGRTS